MQWIHINLIYVAYLNVSAFDQIGKLIRNVIAKFVSHLLKTRQLQGGFAPWPGVFSPGPHWGHSPKASIIGSRFALAMDESPNFRTVDELESSTTS